MRAKTTIILLGAALALLLPIAALADMLTLPQGTELNVSIDQTLDSKVAGVGDQFTAHVQPPYPFDNQGLVGAIITDLPMDRVAR